MYTDDNPNDASSTTFTGRSYILYEYTMGRNKGLGFEILSVFRENNSKKSSNDKKITKILNSWKNKNEKFSPMKPKDVIVTHFQHLTSRNKKANKKKRQVLYKKLASHTTCDYRTFK